MGKIIFDLNKENYFIKLLLIFSFCKKKSKTFSHGAGLKTILTNNV